MSDETARLFIIDQTLKDFQGHHFEYDAAIAEAAQKAGLSPTIVANKKYEKDGTEPAEVVPWFQTTWYDSSADAKHARTFWSETLDFFHRRGLNADDLVLIHTVSLAEFQQIVDFYEGLLWSDVATLPTVYVILRRDPDEFARAALDSLSAKLRRLYEIPDLCDRLQLCSDTELLSEGWGEALRQPVVTLPIPFRHALVDRLERKRDPKAPIQVVYLGDARNEKGYQHFPGMVQALWKDFIQPGRVEVTLQSNYNLPGGEGGIPQARLRLQRYPHGVTLVTEALDPEAYYAILAKADIVVLPYDPDRYTRRSSGVLNEAVSAGKVAVVPEGTWLAAQLAPDRGVAYRHPGGLAGAVIAAIEAFPALSRGAAAHRPKHRSEQNPDRFVQALLQRRSSLNRQPNGAMLYVMDGDSVVNRTGAGSVARQQMQALIELGYRVHAVFQRIHVDEDHNVDAMRRWMEAIRDEVRGLRLASVWGAGHTPFYGHAGLMAERQILRARNLRLDADANYRAASAVPAGLIETLRADPPRFALVNYVQSIPFARMLTGPQTPILTEAHDIQAFQIALRSPEGFQDADLDLELSLLKQARHVVVLNQLEADFLGERLGRDRVSFIAQPVSDGPASLAKLASARDLADVVRNCGPSHPAFAGGSPEPNSATWFRYAKSIDLLYVSSAHGPNLQGLQLFLQHVFMPRLIERGVTLAIAGTICDLIGPLEGPNILLAHRVKDLEPLYAAAKVVILPILDGAGSAIKTIEAMARAKPVVATSFAMRGVDCSSEKFPVYDDWFDFGDRVLELLGSAEKRLAASQASFRLSLVNGNDGSYLRRLGQAVAATLNRPAEAVTVAPPQAPAKPPETLVEWSESIRVFNTLVSDYLTRGYIGAKDLAKHREAPLDRSVAEPLFMAAFETFKLGGGLGSAIDAKRLFDGLMRRIDGSDAAPDRGPQLDSAEIVAPAGTTSRAIVLDAKGVAQVLWRSADERADKKLRASGVLRVTLPSVPPGMMLEHIYDLAEAPPSGPVPCVVTGGMHKREDSPGGARRWSGPETTTTFTIAISRRYDAELCLRVYDVLDGAIYEHAWLEADGQRLPTLKWSQDGRMLVALVPAAPEAMHDRLALALHVPRTISPSSVSAGNGDNRLLGLRVGRLEVRSQITSAPNIALSPVAQALADMRKRTPADVAYAGYRDLLGRDPDPGGYAHYLDLLAERKLSGAQFFYDMINSQEFAESHPMPGLIEQFNRYIPVD